MVETFKSGTKRLDEIFIRCLGKALCVSGKLGSARCEPVLRQLALSSCSNRLLQETSHIWYPTYYPIDAKIVRNIQTLRRLGEPEMLGLLFSKHA